MNPTLSERVTRPTATVTSFSGWVCTCVCVTDVVSSGPSEDRGARQFTRKSPTILFPQESRRWAPQSVHQIGHSGVYFGINKVCQSAIISVCFTLLHDKIGMKVSGKKSRAVISGDMPWIARIEAAFFFFCTTWSSKQRAGGLSWLKLAKRCCRAAEIDAPCFQK